MTELDSYGTMAWQMILLLAPVALVLWIVDALRERAR